MKVILTGAQSTGKTTILNQFRTAEPEFKIVTEVVRRLAHDQNIKINEMGDRESQEVIFKTYKDILFPNYKDLVQHELDNLAKAGDERERQEQNRIAAQNAKEILETEYVSDRGLTDVCAYTIYLNRRSHNMDDLVTEMKKTITEMYKDPDILTVYFPIEFKIVEDGIRSTDEEFRSEIDSIIQELLQELKIPFLKVTGTPHERFNQICERICE